MEKIKNFVSKKLQRMAKQYGQKKVWGVDSGMDQELEVEQEQEQEQEVQQQLQQEQEQEIHNPGSENYQPQRFLTWGKKNNGEATIGRFVQTFGMAGMGAAKDIGKFYPDMIHPFAKIFDTFSLFDDSAFGTDKRASEAQKNLGTCMQHVFGSKDGKVVKNNRQALGNGVFVTSNFLYTLDIESTNLQQLSKNNVIDIEEDYSVHPPKVKFKSFKQGFFLRQLDHYLYFPDANMYKGEVKVLLLSHHEQDLIFEQMTKQYQAEHIQATDKATDHDFSESLFNQSVHFPLNIVGREVDRFKRESRPYRAVLVSHKRSSQDVDTNLKSSKDNSVTDPIQSNVLFGKGIDLDLLEYEFDFKGKDKDLDRIQLALQIYNGEWAFTPGRLHMIKDEVLQKEDRRNVERKKMTKDQKVQAQRDALRCNKRALQDVVKTMMKNWDTTWQYRSSKWNQILKLERARSSSKKKDVGPAEESVS